MGAPRYLLWNFHIPTTAAGTDQDDTRTFLPDGDWDIIDMELMPNASVAADATNYSTYTLVNVTDTVTIMDHATQTTQEGALTVATAVQGTPPTGTSKRVSQGDKFRLRKADTGTGKAGSVSATLWLRQVRP